ncbi:hypothetical protein BCR41DRAFT_368257 [Lobosporangium transversale]|uniref:Myb-like domain-containing protein n=1 Tax=Lobosporangium transversale TaxID=64571 RepID=A0A1Y2GWP0_9FUNG|nr:hypothetical protein BCR41DRAFT_368257 [Lobosporangium transversale]ORZ26720.1 hypothetical protein BCR41DRAFT_368257 [Lobosporangium transversale]|eukprot:XP_021884483.1 hypothetical protein BCR41DRAFT_368257 [Lobosporangium transversale]
MFPSPLLLGSPVRVLTRSVKFSTWKRAVALCPTELTRQRHQYSTATTEVPTEEISESSEPPFIRPNGRVPRSPPKDRMWNRELDEKLSELRAVGKTWDYISLVLKRPASACSDRYFSALDPELQNWTPSMFAKLDQLVEDGESWPNIARALNCKVIACQHQWRTLGRGQYRVKGFLSGQRVVRWSDGEINSFWKAWIKHGMDWVEISKDVETRTAGECSDAFRGLAVAALKDSPGWVKLDGHTFINDAIRASRQRLKAVLNDGSDEAMEGLRGKSLEWTSADHEALLAAVEKHGLFSGWCTIRKQVKPHLSDEQVEAEYYRLSGVVEEGEVLEQSDQLIKRVMWDKDEVERLNMILMKYSSLPVWKKEAKKRGIEPAIDDYENLLRKRNPRLTKKMRAKNEEDWPWTDDRVMRLKRLVVQQRHQEKHSRRPVDWEWIADHIGPHFDPQMCITKWQGLSDDIEIQPTTDPKPWTSEDIDMLEKGLEKYGKAWTLIQQDYLPERSTASIRRKLSNLQVARDQLVKEQKAIARQKKVSNIEEYIDQALKENPFYISARRLEKVLETFEQEHKRIRALFPRGPKKKSADTEIEGSETDEDK